MRGFVLFDRYDNNHWLNRVLNVAKRIVNNWMIIVPVLSLFLVVFYYVRQFGTTIGPVKQSEGDYAAFGQFGDYFGGVLNPLLAFINIALLAYYQKTSIAKSAEKDVLFRMIELQRQIVNGIELRTRVRRAYVQNEIGSDLTTQMDRDEVHEVNSGIRAFWVFDREIMEMYKSRNLSVEDSSVNRLKVLVDVYCSYFHEVFKKQYLAHYFRNLYLIYKMLDDSDVFSDSEKLKYAKIVRAQMSHLELKLLYLNCKLGDGQAFQKYVGKFDLLEWIDDGDFDNYDSAFEVSSVIKADIMSWSTSQANSHKS